MSSFLPWVLIAGCYSTWSVNCLLFWLQRREQLVFIDYLEVKLISQNHGLNLRPKHNQSRGMDKYCSHYSSDNHGCRNTLATSSTKANTKNFHSTATIWRPRQGTMQVVTWTKVIRHPKNRHPNVPTVHTTERAQIDGRRRVAVLLINLCQIGGGLNSFTTPDLGLTHCFAAHRVPTNLPILVNLLPSQLLQLN